jgi:hypothetical protein
MDFDLDKRLNEFKCRPSDFSKLQDLLSYSGKHGRPLRDFCSAREVEFVDSLSSWNGDFTPAQVKWLRSIWDKTIE